MNDRAMLPRDAMAVVEDLLADDVSVLGGDAYQFEGAIYRGYHHTWAESRKPEEAAHEYVHGRKSGLVPRSGGGWMTTPFAWCWYAVRSRVAANLLAR